MSPELLDAMLIEPSPKPSRFGLLAATALARLGSIICRRLSLTQLALYSLKLFL